MRERERRWGRRRKITQDFPSFRSPFSRQSMEEKKKKKSFFLVKWFYFFHTLIHQQQVISSLFLPVRYSPLIKYHFLSTCSNRYVQGYVIIIPLLLLLSFLGFSLVLFRNYGVDLKENCSSIHWKASSIDVSVSNIFDLMNFLSLISGELASSIYLEHRIHEIFDDK